MNAPPSGMDEIMRAVGVLQGGDRQCGRTELLRLWQEWSERDASLQRCTIAHFLADTEDDLAAELAWDLLALEAATGSKDERNGDAVDPALASFLPSLHLNVGDAYRRLNEPQRARRHVDSGFERAGLLEDNGYGNMVRMGLERLRGRLADDR